MKTAVIAAVVLVLAALCSPAAKAWDCPAGQIRQQAPAGTPTTAPYYDVVEGIAFICVPATPPITPSTSSNSSNSTSSANSNSTSASNSTSKSNSNSSATGGNATSTATGGNQQQKQNQSQTATGGNATGGNASAQGGSASNNGNGSNNASYSSTTDVAAPRIPVATAAGIAPGPTAPCSIGFGGGIQTMAIGGSFGGAKVDKNCAILEVARSLATVGSHDGYCAVIVTNKYVKAAGFDYYRCLHSFPEPVVPVQADVVAPVQAVPVVVNVQPAAPVVIPAPTVNVIVPTSPAPAVIVNAKPKVPHSNNKCIPRACPTEKPTVYTDDGNGHVVKEYQN